MKTKHHNKNLQEKLFIGHRGARKWKTENTIESIDLAFDYGATHAEIDIRKTKDGKLVLFHDPITFRFDGKLNFIDKVDYGYLEKLNLPLGGKITTLNDLFVHLKNKPSSKLVIEIKVAGIEEIVLKTIEDYHFLDRVIIWSFSHDIIKRINQLTGKQVKKAILHVFRPITNKGIIQRANECGADYIFPVIRNLKFGNEYYDSQQIRMIDEEEKAYKFLKQGGKGIITANLPMIKNLKSRLSK
jgi:glycerophosphoryl diester phosphodiesterase